MAIFYVYVHGTNIPPAGRYVSGGYTAGGRLLLTCESRYVADELFRKLQGIEDQAGEQLFPSLARSTPQLWCFDGAIDPARTIQFALQSNPFLSEFKSKVMPKALGSTTDYTPEWPIIPIVDGPEWVHNGSYYIRNKRRPGRYWTFNGFRVGVSETEMDKFKIVSVGNGNVGSEILIRSDIIQIYPLNHDGVAGHLGMDGEQSLVVSDTPGEWRFGDLLGGFRDLSFGKHGLVKWTADKEGDDWELC